MKRRELHIYFDPIIAGILAPNLHDLRQSRRQQQPAAPQLGDGEAAAVPRAVRLAEGEQLEERPHDVVGQLLRQAVGDAAHALGG